MWMTTEGAASVFGNLGCAGLRLQMGGKRTLNAIAASGNNLTMEADFLIDGMLSGTGLRDAQNGGYAQPSQVGISPETAAAIAAWLTQYENVHFAGFPEAEVADLDAQGLILRDRVRSELPDKTVEYFSNGLMKLLS